MIGISTQESNTNGAIILKNATPIIKYEGTARISRVATLDGGCVLTHSGYSDADRTLIFTAKAIKSKETILKTLFENESLFTIAVSDGCYSGAISRLRILRGKVELEILYKEKLSS